MKKLYSVKEKYFEIKSIFKNSLFLLFDFYDYFDDLVYLWLEGQRPTGRGDKFGFRRLIYLIEKRFSDICRISVLKQVAEEGLGLPISRHLFFEFFVFHLYFYFVLGIEERSLEIYVREIFFFAVEKYFEKFFTLESLERKYPLHDCLRYRNLFRRVKISILKSCSHRLQRFFFLVKRSTQFLQRVFLRGFFFNTVRISFYSRSREFFGE